MRAVLEAYTVFGVVGLARRDGNRRYYDLLERLLPAEVLTQEVPEHEQRLHKLLSRHRAHGLLGAGGAGGTFDRIAPPQDRKELHRELIEAGAIVPVDVEGMRSKRFVLPEELALLDAPPEPGNSVAFIAPFDSLLWDTKLLASLFGFDYVWEGFFKAEKRRWGYYVLPIALRRPPRRPDRAADRPGQSPRGGTRYLVGEWLRAAPRRRVRRRDARCAWCLRALRRRG